MDFNQLKHNECLILDRYLEDTSQNDLILLVGSYNEMLLKKAKTPFKYTGGIFFSEEHTPESIFSPEYMPFKEKTFDIIVLYHVLPMFKPIGKVLTEAYFSLKDSGRLIIIHGNPSYSSSREYIKSLYQDEGNRLHDKPYHYYKHSLSHLSDELKIRGFSYVTAQALAPVHPIKKVLSGILPYFIEGWVMLYKKEVMPLTPFAQTERVRVTSKRKYGVPAATINQYKDK
ncbi:class I SAM-dependent methyltransferase [Thiotrichales bacterium 19S11-10]|nr:class I SAM-dependent methyltransferase [Thiotrichales bacterium 19S11-10]MCF6807593.1 class I SAM-dependent methyltransferase [Thiotrichales bacterium 19S9-11]MCF6811562.1 class I SAM-dependent methyltransferase [Thiotrichales bacterium 19S9-12]